MLFGGRLGRGIRNGFACPESEDARKPLILRKATSQ